MSNNILILRISVLPRFGRACAVFQTVCIVIVSMVIATSRGALGDQTVTHYSYDDAGRLRQVLVDDGEPATYDYDAVGNLLSIENAEPACTMTEPRVSALTVGTCYPGTDCQFTIIGDGLLDAGVSSGTPFASVNNCHVTCVEIRCTLTMSPDLPVGPRELTISTSFGTAKVLIQVSAPPAVEAAGRAGLWHFTANAGAAVTLSMTRLPNQLDGSSTLDPLLELQDSRGFVVASDDDSGSALPSGPGKNAVLANVTLPATDTYLLIARGSGGTYGTYVLSVEPSSITLLPGAIVPPPEGLMLTFSGSIGAFGERDTLEFAANAGSAARIEVNRVANSADGSGSLDPTVEVRDSRNILLAADDDGGTNEPPGPGRNALIPNLLLPATDTYRLVVFSNTGSVGPYIVHVTLTASPPAGASASAENGGNP